MSLLDILRGLVRRWYVVLPGMLLAAAGAFGAWTVVPPDYERSAFQLLLPGQGTLPEGASNPFLYLGGLTAPADVLVRAASSEDSLRSILDEHPSVEIEIVRDAAAAGPMILTKVTAPSDAEAGDVLTFVVQKTTDTLETLQAAEGIPEADRIVIALVSIEEEGVARQRDRLVASAGVGLGLAIVTLVLASVMDGLAARSRRRKPSSRVVRDEEVESTAGERRQTRRPRRSSAADGSVEDEAHGDGPETRSADPAPDRGE